jgi:hypothetical protein
MTPNELNEWMEHVAAVVDKADGKRMKIYQVFKDNEDATEVMKAIIADDRFATCVSHLRIEDLHNREDAMPEFRWSLIGIVNYNNREYKDNERTDS